MRTDIHYVCVYKKKKKIERTTAATTATERERNKMEYVWR